MVDGETTLNPQHEAFVSAYVGEARFNATKAAEMAKYAIPHVSGWDCMQREDVKAAIKRRTAATAMHADELLMLIGHEARGAGDYIDVVTEMVPDGDKLVERDTVFVDVKRMKKDGRRHLIKKVSNGPNGQTIEFVDPLAAQAMLVKALGINPPEKVDVTSKGESLAGKTQAEVEAIAAGALAKLRGDVTGE